MIEADKEQEVRERGRDRDCEKSVCVQLELKGLTSLTSTAYLYSIGL